LWLGFLKRDLVKKLADKRVLKTITRELSGVKQVLAVILYGSYAREDYSVRSDVDLFMIIDNKIDRSIIEDKIIALENRTGRSIQPTIRTRKEVKETDSGLLQNIFQEGKILYLREPLEIKTSLLLKQKPFILFTFKLKNLSQKEKVRFNRRLYSQEKKKYEYQGLLKRIGGEKLTPGCLLIPYGKKEFIEKLFHKFNLQHKEIKIWR